MEQNPEINPHICGQWTFDKGAKSIQSRKNRLFNKWCWEKWIYTCQRIKLDPDLTPYTNINSKWSKDLNIRTKTIIFLEENIEITLHYLGFGNGFILWPLQHEQQKKIWTNWSSWKLITLVHQKTWPRKWKGSLYGRKYLQVIYLVRDKQQGPTAWHRELYSISCKNYKWKRIWKRIYIHICVYIYKYMCVRI